LGGGRDAAEETHLTVVFVGDVNGLSTVLGLLRSRSVHGSVESNNHVTGRVVTSAAEGKKKGGDKSETKNAVKTASRR